MGYKLVGLVVLALGATVAGGQAGKTDLDKLQGVWEMVKVKVGDKDVELPPQARQTITIKGNKSVSSGGGKEDKESTITLDEAKKHITIVNTGADKKEGRGLYRFEGDTFQVALGSDTTKAPESFDGKDLTILTLKRVKK